MRSSIKSLSIPLMLLASVLLAPAYSAYAQSSVPAVNLSAQPDQNGNGAFKLSNCDGPALPNNVPPPANLGHTYVPCDFRALMTEAQFLINTMMVVGVMAALLGFAYAGFLYVRGTSDSISKATSMFPKIAGGFIIMLTAWFIVYQVLAWLTGTSGVAAFLGQ